MNPFWLKLKKIQIKHNSLICVGLDTDLKKIPKHLLADKDPILTFNQKIIETTHRLVCAYKPNIAFYEAQGAKGLESLKKTIAYLKANYPEIAIILDAKRGDIGYTNSAYAQLIFDYLQAEAVTLHPYLGKESLLPFLSLRNKFFFILCRTSNPKAGEFQDLKVRGEKFYQYLAERVRKTWNFNNNCGLVVGATFPQELKVIREIVGDKMLLLAPGVGKQGGKVKDVVRAGQNKTGFGLIINASRSIIFASNDRSFAQKAKTEAKKLKDLVNKYRIKYV